MGKMTDDSCRTSVSRPGKFAMRGLFMAEGKKNSMKHGRKWWDTTHNNTSQLQPRAFQVTYFQAGGHLASQRLPRITGALTALSAAAAACLQHYKQTVKQRLGCVERLFYSSNAQLVVDHHRSGLALVMSALRHFFSPVFTCCLFVSLWINIKYLSFTSSFGHTDPILFHTVTAEPFLAFLPNTCNCWDA